VLLKVAFMGALVVPTGILPKFKLVGARFTAAITPAPVNAALWGLPLALSVTDSVPARMPVLVGLKLTLILQLVPASKLGPQLLVCV
jgi:hypothetical protein